MAANAPSMLVYGTDMALVSSKLARSFPDATIVSVLGLSVSSHSTVDFERLMNFLDVKTIVPCAASFNYETVLALAAQPVLLDVVILSSAVFSEIVVQQTSFFEHFGRMLTLARVTYVEVVDADMLRSLLGVLAVNANDFIFEGLVAEALRQVGVTQYNASFIDTSLDALSTYFALGS
jgi:hypothetical protein